jgi:hypothetical protein
VTLPSSREGALQFIVISQHLNMEPIWNSCVHHKAASQGKSEAEGSTLKADVMQEDSERYIYAYSTNESGVRILILVCHIWKKMR